MTRSKAARSPSPAAWVIGVLLLAGLGCWAWFGGHAYARVKHQEAAASRIHEHKPQALLELRADENARLHAGIPIEEAMQRLATRGRTGIGAALMPQQSTDTAPLMGWAFQPHDVPEWMLAPPAAPTPPSSPDAGVPPADSAAR